MIESDIYLRWTGNNLEIENLPDLMELALTCKILLINYRFKFGRKKNRKQKPFKLLVLNNPIGIVLQMYFVYL